MSSLVRFIYYVSIVLFLGILFFTYYQFPSFVPIGYSSNLEMKNYVSKVSLFYYASGAFFAFNILILVLKKISNTIPFSLFFFPYKKFWLASVESREALITVITTWFNSWAAIFNLFLSYILFALFMVNVVELKTYSFYLPPVYLGIIMIALWGFVLMGRLSYKKFEM